MKRALLLLLTCLPGWLYSQDFAFEIKWTESSDTLTFYGADHSQQEAPLPWYHCSLTPATNELSYIPELHVTEASEVGKDKYYLFDGQLPGKEPKLSVSGAYERKHSVLQLSLLPFYTDTCGRILKIEKFTVSLKKEENLAALKSSKKTSYSTGSVLASGNWFRIRVSESGIHKLSYEDLQDIGLSNPAQVRIFGAGAVQLPEDITNGQYDDLSPLALYMDKGSDGLFGPGDFILFYARGIVEWSYDNTSGMYLHHLHPYALNGSYFLTDSKGTAGTPPQAVLSDEAETDVVTSGELMLYREKEQYNLIASGREWLDDVFSLDLNHNYAFNLEGLKVNETVKIRVRVAAQSLISSSFTVKANGNSLGSISVASTNYDDYTMTQAREGIRVFETSLSQEELTLSLDYNKTESDAKGWLNSISINARQDLTMSSDELIICDSRSTGFGHTALFRVENINDKTEIWEITDESAPARVAYSKTGSRAEFRVASDAPRQFIAFRTDGSFSKPLFEGGGKDRIANQDLHGSAAPDLIIVYDTLFSEQVMRLAEHRRSHDNLDVLTVTQEQIFNEFSSGTPDVSALRNYLKMYYDRSGSEDMPRYLLLFGDGSVDNRNKTANNPNFILTYQSVESFVPTSSYVSDDFYGLLDAGEDLKAGLVDIGIGRFPVSTPEEAEAVVDKVIAYDDPENMGDWRNYICFIGDDEDSNIHMYQANSLANYVESNYPAYNINKIFLDAYEQLSTPIGERYPDVTQAINDQMNRGALIINYTGHGGTNALAHEQILTTTNINNWSNRNRQPLFMTATCEFSRYDLYLHEKDQEETSAGELVLLNPDGGGIGLFTTTRLVYAGPNHALNEKFYEIVFKKDSLNRGYRLGDIIAYSKNNVGAELNKRNFTLLGDPAMQLVYPVHRVLTDSINHRSLEELTDTLSALDFVSVSGHIETCDNEPFPDFNGVIYPVVFDKTREVVTLANDGGYPMTFTDRKNILYKGKATVTGGRFSFSFYVPKDINFSMGNGKISYYANDSLTDAHGATTQVIIGGVSDDYFDDLEGPVIKAYMNDTLFRDGGITDPDPDLLILIRDNFGINTTGIGIGHDITATIDGDRANSLNLNGYYQANTNSYTGGEVRYPYNDLTEGLHSISVKAWDIHNNSSETELSFVVVTSARLVLEDLFNYPNPVTDQTFFNITHNMPEQNFRVLLNIYNMNGELVRQINENTYSSGYRIEPLSWDGRSENGHTLAEGIYIYRVIIENEQGDQASGSGKLLLVKRL